MAALTVEQHDGTHIDYTAVASQSAGDVVQAPDGRAGIVDAALSSGARGTLAVSGVYRVPKTTGQVLLAGGRLYWVYSTNKAAYLKANSRDFYIGRLVADAGSADTTCYVELNIDPPYDIDLARDAFRSVLVGTQALGGLALLRRGGAHNFLLSSTSEAQKLDALTVDGFTPGTRAIVEMCFAVANDGAGSAVDVSLGVANATHATDADSITNHLLIHLDANATAINAQSKDGTTTVTATDTTTTYTEGSAVANRVEVWLDMRTPAACLLYVNGVQVLSGTTFDVSAATGPWKLLAHIEKTSAADVYELDLHWLRTRFTR